MQFNCDSTSHHGEANLFYRSHWFLRQIHLPKLSYCMDLRFRRWIKSRINWLVVLRTQDQDRDGRISPKKHTALNAYSISCLISLCIPVFCPWRLKFVVVSIQLDEESYMERVSLWLLTDLKCGLLQSTMRRLMFAQNRANVANRNTCVVAW